MSDWQALLRYIVDRFANIKLIGGSLREEEKYRIIAVTYFSGWYVSRSLWNQQ